MSNDEYRSDQAERRQHGLKARQASRQERHVLRSRWRAQPDNLVGGWCVTLDIPGTPADGNPPIADFVHEKVALHIAGIHNDWLADLTTDAPHRDIGKETSMADQRLHVLGPCPTTWSTAGWRAWRDRILYGHVGHRCANVEHHTVHHTCTCGARIAGPAWRSS